MVHFRVGREHLIDSEFSQSLNAIVSNVSTLEYPTGLNF